MRTAAAAADLILAVAGGSVVFVVARRFGYRILLGLARLDADRLTRFERLQGDADSGIVHG